MKYFFIAASLLLLLAMGCKGGREAADRELVFDPGPHAVVYKTQKDYSQNVPVILSEDGSRIVSYPAPSDLRPGGELALPLQLTGGYLLDKRGIGPRVAFTSYTYEAYAALPAAPPVDQLFESIIDAAPLKDMCDCGLMSQFEDLEQELNALVKARLKPCKPLIEK